MGVKILRKNSLAATYDKNIYTIMGNKNKFVPHNFYLSEKLFFQGLVTINGQ